MTDADQEKLYEDYWLKIEKMINRNQMSEFFLDYLNMKMDNFAKESMAYDDFKRLFERGKYTNESTLKELHHYAEFYHAFMMGDPRFSDKINEYLSGLRQLKQTTVFLFLFHVFDDLNSGQIDERTVEQILQLLQNYSIRRIMCEISSNSLRGLYKTMYGRVFGNTDNKKHYYDAIVSFLLQLTSRDAIPRDDDFKYALKNYNLFRKHALCRFLLLGIENNGKETVVPDNLTIEHVLPQNKNGLSTAWQNMIGENWADIKERWQDTLGNLTLTGYNSELGDKPFCDKKALIENQNTKVVNLYKDIRNKDYWNEKTIQERADRLIKDIMRIYPICWPKEQISFRDTSYTEYTCAEPENATYKHVNYYEILGERVNVDSFAVMVRSVARKLYDLDSSIIERMALTGETIDGWSVPVFSYDKSKVHGDIKLFGTEIYIYTGMSARDCISFIRGLLWKYELNIEEDFVYSAKPTNLTTTEMED